MWIYPVHTAYSRRKLYTQLRSVEVDPLRKSMEHINVLITGKLLACRRFKQLAGLNRAGKEESATALSTFLKLIDVAHIETVACVRRIAHRCEDNTVFQCQVANL